MKTFQKHASLKAMKTLLKFKNNLFIFHIWLYNFCMWCEMSPIYLFTQTSKMSTTDRKDHLLYWTATVHQLKNKNKLTVQFWTFGVTPLYLLLPIPYYLTQFYNWQHYLVFKNIISFFIVSFTFIFPKKYSISLFFTKINPDFAANMQF